MSEGCYVEEQIGQIPDSLTANQYSKSLEEFNEYSVLFCMHMFCMTFKILLSSTQKLLESPVFNTDFITIWKVILPIDFIIGIIIKHKFDVDKFYWRIWYLKDDQSWLDA